MVAHWIRDASAMEPNIGSVAAQCNEVQPSRSMKLGSNPLLISQAVVLAESLNTS